VVGPVEKTIKTIVTGFGWNGTSDLRVDRLPGDMGSKMRVVIASSGSRLPTDAADVRLFASVHLQMVSQIVTPGELLVAVLTFVIPGARMLRHVTLPVALNSELEATFVADKRFHPPV